MNQTIRTRYFLWLTVILLVFFLLNTLLLLAINLPTILDKGPDWKNEFYEWVIITATGLAALPMALLAAWKVSLWMLAPLQHIVRTANHIEAGHFAERVSVPDAHDEISSLAESLNRALDRYQAAMERQRQFNGTASHQLRTPLASIRARGEVALQKDRTAAEYRETIEIILEVCDGMEKAVAQLLLMARLRDEDLYNAFAPVSIAHMFETLVEQYEPLYVSKNITITMDTANTTTIQANRELLLQALANILCNAITHTPPGGSIHLGARPDTQAGITITITDSGPGLPPAYVEPGDAARRRNHQAQNPGLGLLIVESIIQLHGGHIAYTNDDNAGACVTLRLPQPRPIRAVATPIVPRNENSATTPAGKSDAPGKDPGIAPPIRSQPESSPAPRPDADCNS